MNRTRRIFIGLVALVALALPAAALAGNPSSGGVISDDAAGGLAGSTTSGALPFTGLDIAVVLGIGAALLVAGIFLRRRARHESA